MKRSAIVEEVENNAISGDAANTTSILVNATILYHECNLETALKVLHAAPSYHLEYMALRYYTELNQIPYNQVSLINICYFVQKFVLIHNFHDFKFSTIYLAE